MPVELPSPEPSELEEIRLLRRSARHRYDLARVRAVYPQRVLSGWLARGQRACAPPIPAQATGGLCRTLRSTSS